MKKIFLAFLFLLLSSMAFAVPIAAPTDLFLFIFWLGAMVLSIYPPEFVYLLLIIWIYLSYRCLKSENIKGFPEKSKGAFIILVSSYINLPISLVFGYFALSFLITDFLHYTLGLIDTMTAATISLIISLASPPIIFFSWYLMLTDCLKRTDFKGKYDKIIWLLVLTFLNIFGAILYYYYKVKKKPKVEKEPEVKKKLWEKELLWTIIALVSFILTILSTFVIPLKPLVLLFFFIFIISLGIWGIKPIIDFVKKRRSFGWDLLMRAFILLAVCSRVLRLGAFFELNIMLLLVTGLIWVIKSGVDFVRKRET